MLVDYYVLRGTKLNTAELFEERGEYSYSGGWNIAAVIALLLGVLPNVPGFLNAAFPQSFAGVSDPFKTLYTYAWFVGLAISATVYAAWMSLARVLRATFATSQA
jgi:nucleobase:cation symporter-1, NCS1 family